MIKKNDVVTLSYTLKNSEGVDLGKADAKEPLNYLHGVGGNIPGLEEEVEGLKVGDKKDVTVPPEKGYGERSDQNIHKVPLSGFQADGDEKLVAGMQVRVETNEGISIADVASIDGEEVTLDLNHPLAGEALHFDVEVMDIREATKEELDHGHAHGPGGHHHH